jgi:hypothetical protein
MYMFVLVTLIVALIGIYAQVFNMQTAHMNAQETGIAQALLDWHATATGLAQNAIAALSAGTGGGCSLAVNFVNPVIPGGPPYCVNSVTGSIYLAPTGVQQQPGPGLQNCSGTRGPPCIITLPQSYGGVSNLAFYSMAYGATLGGVDQDYVLTFIPKPPTLTNGMPSFLCLPGAMAGSLIGCGQTIDIGMNDFVAQIKHRGVSMFAYGTVATCTVSATCPTGRQLVTSPVPNASGTMTPMQYPVPFIVPPGAFGVISQISLCTGC